MKRNVFWLGMLAMVLAFGMTACGGDDDSGGVDSALNGTWVNTAEGIKIVLNNGSITMSNDNVEMMRGTYSTSGSNITVTFTQVKGDIFGEDASEMGLSPNQWYTEQQLKTAMIQAMVSGGMSQSEAEEEYNEYYNADDSPFGSSTGAYTLSGNTLTVTWGGETTVFTKQ